MMHEIGYSGAWQLAVIAIIIASWVLYRYFAPDNWREWASAGTVQAFIIALYAEMYGFPLTVYAAVRLLGIDNDNLSANLWSSLLGIGDMAMVLAMIAGYAFVIMGVVLVVKGWRQLYAARHSKVLATDRLYSLVRHPQYLGLFLILFGEGVVHWPTVFSVSLFPIIVLAYVLLARREEKRREENVGRIRRTISDLPAIGTGFYSTLGSVSGRYHDVALVPKLTCNLGECA